MCLASLINSVKEPKQAKPAFLVLAPLEKSPRSKIAILALGFNLRYSRAQNIPLIPPPRTTKS